MRFSSILVLGFLSTHCFGADSDFGFRFKEGRKLKGQLVLQTELKGAVNNKRKETTEFTWTESGVKSGGSATITISHHHLRYVYTESGRKDRVYDNNDVDKFKGDPNSRAARSYPSAALRRVPQATLTFVLHADGTTSDVHPPTIFDGMEKFDRDIGGDHHRQPDFNGCEGTAGGQDASSAERRIVEAGCELERRRGAAERANADCI